MALEDLEEELAYVTRSLEDLEREHDAGDLGDEDFRRLRDRYRTQLAELEHDLALEPVGRPDAPTGQARAGLASSSRRNRMSSPKARLVIGWGSVICLVAASTLIVLALTHAGPFARSPQLSVDARVQIMLAEADILGSKGDVTQALATYDRVLALQPAQPVALANGGWLARLAGLSQHETSLLRNGDAEIEAAVHADPSYGLAHAYDGVLQLEDRHAPALAVQQFRAMLADAPSPTLLWSVHATAIRAFEAAHQPVPAAISGAKKPRT